jgi:hypothetical protein
LKAIQDNAEDCGGDDSFCDDPEIVKHMVHIFYHLGNLPTAELRQPTVEAVATAANSEIEEDRGRGTSLKSKKSPRKRLMPGSPMTNHFPQFRLPQTPPLRIRSTAFATLPL